MPSGDGVVAVNTPLDAHWVAVNDETEVVTVCWASYKILYTYTALLRACP